jgi:hypothetical protein
VVQDPRAPGSALTPRAPSLGLARAAPKRLHPASDVALYQGLRAAQTYLAVKSLFSNEGAYVARVDTSCEWLALQVQERVAANDTRSPQFQLLGKDVLVPTISSPSTTLPGLDRRVKAHESLLKFTPPDEQSCHARTQSSCVCGITRGNGRSGATEGRF